MSKKDKFNWNAIGLDHNQLKNKYPTFRFSEEVLQLVNIMSNVMTKAKYVNEEKEACTLSCVSIAQNILGLLFEPKMSEIMKDKNYQRYLYPYLAKVKMVGFLEENLSIVHKENFMTAFKAFISFITCTHLTNDS